MRRPRLKHALSAVYLLIFAVLAFMFFTNDFGLLDLRKTSVVIGVALDTEGDDVVLTAQLAVPQPAENGENTKFNIVTGTGPTIASALNEINVKTGFYPKLVFCKLIVIGESCFDRDLKTLLDYFFRNEYTGLTLSVAACEGKASELIAQQFPCGNSATDVIDKLLSDEARASGNVSTTTVKVLGEKLFSPSECAYMPYLENGILEEEGGGEDGGSGGESGGSGGGGGGSQQCEESELVCDKCAVFSEGVCKGVLSKDQTFALNLLYGDVRHAFMESGESGEGHVLGLRDCKGDVVFKVEGDSAMLELKFAATVKIQDDERGFSPEKVKEGGVKDEILRTGEDTVCALFESLFNEIKSLGCDVFGLRTKLYKNYYGKYEEMKEDIYDNLEFKCNVKLRSSS